MPTPTTRRHALIGLLLAGAAAAGRRAALAQPYPFPAVPPPRFERSPGRPPRRDARWRPGHWQWNGRGYVWVPGAWIVRRGRGSWRGGRWVRRRGAWVRAPGGWY